MPKRVLVSTIKPIYDSRNTATLRTDAFSHFWRFAHTNSSFPVSIRSMDTTKRSSIVKFLTILIAGALIGGYTTQKCQEQANARMASPKPLSDEQIAVLNHIRDEINFTYGYVDGWPRIDRGPCGRFANLFYREWNQRFRDKVCIAFIMTTNGICDHVLIKLPDDNYYDGGNGVISSPTLLREFRGGDRIEDMEVFDFSLLDKRSYSLKRSYPLCTNYSDEATENIIEHQLARLPRD